MRGRCPGDATKYISYRFRAEVLNLTAEPSRVSTMYADITSSLYEARSYYDLVLVDVVVVVVVVVVTVVVVRHVSIAFPVIAPVQTFCYRQRNQTRIIRGGSKRGPGGVPPVKILPPPLCSLLLKFMIKHNLPLVRGGSLWQYRSVPPQLQLWPPNCPPM